EMFKKGTAVFNGAVTRDRRRLDLLVGAAVEVVAASMGPSIVIDGDAPAQMSRISGSKGFNGAVDRDRRRHHLGAPRDPPVHLASMGPAIGIDGDELPVRSAPPTDWRQMGRSTG